MKPRAHEAGLTLAELMVVSAVLVYLTGLVYGTLRYQTRTYDLETTKTLTQSNLRTWLARMVKDIRRAGFDPLESGGFGVVAFSPTELRFTTDADSDGVVAGDGSENLGYKFENGVISMWLGGSQWRPILQGVGSLTFVYRDVRGNPVETVAEDVSEVEIALAVQATSYAGRVFSSGGAPAPVVTTTTSGARATITTSAVPGAAPVVSQVEKATIRNPS